MNIEPLFDRVLVEKIEQSDQTPGGLFIPQDAKQPSQLCHVVEVGTGRNIDAPGRYIVRPHTARRAGIFDAAVGGFFGLCVWALEVILGGFTADVERPAMHVKKGDHVLIGKFSGTEVELNGKTLFIVREDEILAIVHEDAVEELPPGHGTDPSTGKWDGVTGDSNPDVAPTSAPAEDPAA